MGAKTEQLPILVGLVMALAAVVAALGLLLTYPLALFPELLVNCGRAGLGEAACSSGAHKVGLVSVGAGALALIVTIAAACWKAPWAKRAEQYHPTVVRFLLAVSAAVVSAHLGAQYFGPADLTPFRLLQRYSGYISIENLLWPVLVQVLVLQRDMFSRLQILAILLPITAVTPHRAVVVAIFIFGFVLLLVADFWQVLESRTTRRAVHRFTAQLAIVVVAAGCFASSFYFQSRNRSLDWSPVKAPVLVGATAPVMPGIFGDRLAAGSGQEVKALASGVWTDVARRTIHPLVQAAMVENIALSRSLPTILDEMRRKLRLATAPTLNEFIYVLCYGDSGVGQATVLYYGEAIAYWPFPPITWMILAPLVLVGICFGLRKRGIVVSTIVGIGLWRGSLAGMVTLLPAMVLQTLTLVVATLLTRWSAATSFDWTKIARLAHGILLVSLSALLLALTATAIGRTTADPWLEAFSIGVLLIVLSASARDLLRGQRRKELQVAFSDGSPGMARANAAGLPR